MKVSNKEFVNIKLLEVKEQTVEVTLPMLMAEARKQALFGKAVYFKDPVGRCFRIEQIELDAE